MNNENCEKTEEGEIYLPGFVLMHLVAKLTDEQLLVLKTWAFAI